MNVKIDFRIFSTHQSMNFERVDLIEGGLRIIIDDTVITKYQNDPTDEGYRGDYIFIHLGSWLNGISLILGGNEYRSQLLDNPGVFIFSPHNDITFIKYLDNDRPEGVVRIRENGEYVTHCWDFFNRKYPNYPRGTPVPTISLILEILNTAEKFLDYLEKNAVSSSGDMKNFRHQFEEKRRIANKYIRSHQEENNN